MLIKIGKEHLKDIQKTHDALSSGKIIINSGGTSYFIHPSDIICCEAEGAYSRIFYITGQELVQILCSQNLGRYENILNSNRFLRVHKKYLVNTDYVKSCKRNKLKLVANKEEIQVLIARDRRKEILEQIAINREDMGL
jgi:two-component system LytT family response regulator